MTDQPRIGRRPWITRGGRARRVARVTVVVIAALVGFCLATMSRGLAGIRRVVEGRGG